jgi:hypothetical protein
MNTKFEQPRQRVEHQNNAAGDINNIVNLIVLSSDNIKVIKELQKLGLFGNDTDEAERQVGRLCEEILQRQESMSRELGQQANSTVSEQLLKDYEHFSDSLKRLQDVGNLLNSFKVLPQPMMINETVTFVLGGKAGDYQPATHIAKAIRDKKIRIEFKGLNSFDKIGIKVERDPSFPTGPLKVVIPAGTCISSEASGRIRFRSFFSSQEKLGPGRRILID